MKTLQLGYCKLKEIQDFFGIVAATFSKNKEKYLDILKEYCDYEIKHSKNSRILGVTILEIFNEGPYESKKDLREQVEKFVEKEWGKYDDPAHTADSLTIVTNRYCEQYGIEWKLPRYTVEIIPYIDEPTQKKRKRIEQKSHNPEMKKWWQVYGIIARSFHKEKQNGEKYSKRVFLEVSNNKLICKRLTKENEEKINKISERIFGSKALIEYEISELIEVAKANGQVTEEDIYEIITISNEIKDGRKMNAFIQECIRQGLGYIVKGCDRLEMEKITIEQEKGENKND